MMYIYDFANEAFSAYRVSVYDASSHSRLNKLENVFFFKMAMRWL